MKFFILLLLSCYLFAEDIHLKNGTTYKNIELISETSSAVYIKYNGYNVKIERERIKEIIYSDYNSDKPGEITDKPVVMVYNDPCHDKVLLQLQKKDSLTVEEMKIYVELKKQCEQSRRVEYKPIKQNDDELNSALTGLSKSAKTYFTLASIVLVVGLVLVLIK